MPADLPDSRFTRPERVRALSDFIRPLGVRLNLGENLLPRLFNNVMQRAEAGGHHPTISEAVLRTQAQAVYHTQNIGHFGLNLGRYAHFTSPIRRYADLTVHRALIRALKLGPKPSHDGQSDGEQARLQNIAEAVSATERRAMLAERTAADRYLSAYMAHAVRASNLQGGFPACRAPVCLSNLTIAVPMGSCQWRSLARNGFLSMMTK